MDTILDALQEGRLFELPENDKDGALHFLAHIIEAFPSVPDGTDVDGIVMKRENVSTTALGKGWACPHARVPFDEDLMCVIGWSPSGIDYTTPDGQPVFLVIMYLVPENQRHHYLREISQLAKAIEGYSDFQNLRGIKKLDEVRNFLLDMVESSKGTGSADIRARMIRLQVKPEMEGASFRNLSNLVVEAFFLIVSPNLPPLVLTQNPALLESLGNARDLVGKLENEGTCQKNGWRILRRSGMTYQGGRILYDCLGVQLAQTATALPAETPL